MNTQAKVTSKELRMIAEEDLGWNTYLHYQPEIENCYSVSDTPEEFEGRLNALFESRELNYSPQEHEKFSQLAFK